MTKKDLIEAMIELAKRNVILQREYNDLRDEYQKKQDYVEPVSIAGSTSEHKEM